MPRTFLDSLRTNSGAVKTHQRSWNKMLILLTKPLIISLFVYRPVKSVQCSSDPEFAFFKRSSKVSKNNGKFDRTLRQT